MRKLLTVVLCRWTSDTCPGSKGLRTARRQRCRGADHAFCVGDSNRPLLLELSAAAIIEV